MIYAVSGLAITLAPAITRHRYAPGEWSPCSCVRRIYLTSIGLLPVDGILVRHEVHDIMSSDKMNTLNLVECKENQICGR